MFLFLIHVNFSYLKFLLFGKKISIFKYFYFTSLKIVIWKVRTDSWK